ncbi:hypothetical protein M758_9G172800 [Ceratodon purpureus]|nr:hypothetical protein M758_9G172800 [Ceratodon purpureus]
MCEMRVRCWILQSGFRKCSFSLNPCTACAFDMGHHGRVFFFRRLRTMNSELNPSSSNTDQIR